MYSRTGPDRDGQKEGTGSGRALVARSSASFFRRISRTFRWLLEWTLLMKVGLHAGRYSGSRRPDLYRTPHALHRVFAPSGPARHCGVF